MDLKEKVLRAAGPKYTCLEFEQVGNDSIVTIAKEGSRLLLNYEIAAESFSVNFVDKKSGVVIEEYEAAYTSDEDMQSKLATSVATFEAVVDSDIEALDTEDDQSRKFISIIEDGSPDLIKALSTEELREFDTFVANNVTDGIGKKLCHSLINTILSDRAKLESSESSAGIIPAVVSPEEMLLTEASAEQLLEAFIESVGMRIDTEDNDLVLHVLEDICVQAEGMLDELSQVISN